MGLSRQGQPRKAASVWLHSELDLNPCREMYAVSAHRSGAISAAIDAGIVDPIYS